MVSSTSALLRLYRSNTAPPAEPPSRERGTLRSTAPIEVMSRRRYVPLRLSTRWAWRSHFLAPTRARISSSRTTSKATRIAPLAEGAQIGAEVLLRRQLKLGNLVHRKLLGLAAKRGLWVLVTEELPLPFQPPRTSDSHRHHGKVAAELQERADLMGEGRPLPPRSGTVGIARSQPKEDAHGTVHRTGCSCGELHPCSDTSSAITFTSSAAIFAPCSSTFSLSLTTRPG